MTAEQRDQPDCHAWMFDGGGEMGERVRRLDWAATPIGPVSGWSSSLNATVAMLLHSRHPMFLWWGPSLIQIYNDAYLPSFGVGKHPAALGQAGHECWPEIWSIIGPQIDAVMRQGIPSWHEDALVPIFRNGAIEEVYWTYGYSPVFDDNGAIGGTLVVCTETTARIRATRQEAALRLEMDQASRRVAEERASLLEHERRARQAAELASRAKDDFLSTASHELRTPLNAILGWARMLQGGVLRGDDTRRAVDSIERNARIQVRLIEDILDGSRLLTGKLQLEVRPIDLTALVQAALDAVRAAADAKGISLTVRMDPAAAMTGDPERLQQVVWNLVNNAIKFTPKAGAVAVTLERIGHDVRLTVTDNGEGIDAEFLPHVFEQFRQAEGSTTRRHGGLGLGLALVRHLVEAHGGTVRADSDGPGKGAMFTVWLPVQAAFVPSSEPPAVPFAAPPGGDRAPEDLRGMSILVVDDEPDARDLVATVLRSTGAEVTIAATAAEALALISVRAFDALVSDIGMPSSDGYSLIARIREAGVTRLPAVAVTAYSREEDRRRALDAGFQAYVAKPVEPASLIGLVARLVGVERG